MGRCTLCNWAIYVEIHRAESLREAIAKRQAEVQYTNLCWTLCWLFVVIRAATCTSHGWVEMTQKSNQVLERPKRELRRRDVDMISQVHFSAIFTPEI